jgi:hypothetical protein
VADSLPVNSFIQLRITRDGAVFETWARVIYDRQGVGMGFLFIRTAAEQAKVLENWLGELQRS